jgi:hypothetical protein
LVSKPPRSTFKEIELLVEKSCEVFIMTLDVSWDFPAQQMLRFGSQDHIIPPFSTSECPGVTMFSVAVLSLL